MLIFPAERFALVILFMNGYWFFKQNSSMSHPWAMKNFFSA